MERKPEATRKPTFGAGGDGRRRRADGLSLLGYAEVLDATRNRAKSR